MDGEGLSPAQIAWPQKPKAMHALTSEEEFASLVRRQSRFVFRVAYSVLLNGHDAEEAVQETFLKLYRNGGWRELKNEQAFLARVAWRVAVDTRRRSLAQSDRYASQRDPDNALNPDADPPSVQPGPEAVLLAADRDAAVHAAINSLPEALRVPLVLSSFDELNSREIGKILDVPEGTIRTRLQRARQMLRRKLTGLEGGRYA